jgi:hypothetical protein
MPEVVAFTSPLADTREDRETTVVQRNVVDQLHNDDGLADSGTAEETDLAALLYGSRRSTTLMPVSRTSVFVS